MYSLWQLRGRLPQGRHSLFVQRGKIGEILPLAMMLMRRDSLYLCVNEHHGVLIQIRILPQQDSIVSAPRYVGHQDQTGFLQQLNFAFGETGQAAMEIVELHRDSCLVCTVALQRADEA